MRAIKERKGEVSIPNNTGILGYDNLSSQGAAPIDTPFVFEGKTYRPPANSHWKAHYPDGMEKLRIANRLAVVGNTLRYVRYIVDNPVDPLRNSITADR